MVPVNLSFLSILQEVLRWVFENVLMPVIKDVFNILVTLIGELIINALSGILLEIWVILLKVVDFLEDIFSIFSGLTSISLIKDVDLKTGVQYETTNQGIVQYLFGLGSVQKTFMVIMAISLVLCMLTTMISVIRSMADSPFENKKPISAVLQTSLKCCLTFALLQFACIFAIQMTTQVLLQINLSINAKNDQSSMGDQIFYMLAQGHEKGGTDIKKYASGAKYANVSDITSHFDYVHFNWIIVIVATVFILGILLATIIGSVQRLMMILILYIVSPLFVAYMPLDEGKSFGQWRETFVAYLISAFSPILSMKLFMMFLPFMMEDKLRIPGIDESQMVCVKLLFIIGGALAIYTSRNLFLKVLNPSLAGQMDGNGAAGSKAGSIAFAGVNKIIAKIGA
ncbi:MAG: hypothetical protein J6N53_04300 [Lachnospiraceae bacterium]|nr:hypothetical protein [Lachnospiraceae bacterium]MBO6298046.1 hypothetical protein [Lachnospiraceae bacterium]